MVNYSPSKVLDRPKRGAADDDHGAEVSIDKITPAKAMELLSRNIRNNRHVDRRMVARYAEEMKSGLWREEVYDPIRVSGDGQLLDGQHRLLAIAESGVSMTMLVVRGLAPETMHAIDIGKRRSPTDLLKISGYTHCSLLAATARVLLQLKQGPIRPITSGNYSAKQLMDAVERHPGLQESCRAYQGRLTGIRPAAVTAVHYVATQFLDQREAAERFLQVLTDGLPTYTDDAAWAFREFVLRSHRGRRRFHSGYTYNLMGTVHAWNNFVSQQPVRLFKIPSEVTFRGLDVRKL